MRPLDIELIKANIRETSPETEIMIGCDSQKCRGRKRKGFFQYIVVVIIHIDGKHGCQIYGAEFIERDYGQLKPRLMNEVYLATDVAFQILDAIGDRKMSIHLDINTDPSHKSNVALKEAVGYVRGMLGVEPILKPEAIAASTCADYYAKG